MAEFISVLICIDFAFRQSIMSTYRTPLAGPVAPVHAGLTVAIWLAWVPHPVMVRTCPKVDPEETIMTASPEMSDDITSVAKLIVPNPLDQQMPVPS
jgi:hypothetical protein